ncbi:hypothetical protein EB118_01265 [bacterium]|nr:hypothetical protein [bacterium]NDC93887.1 hypothetical protein [bacterium]NDD82834.1 hypothetical protein [bacterium]NDG28718.1 hypothetical protein [bacterium]
MNQDPTQLSQDSNAQNFVAAAESAKQPTPAESLGVVDGNFDVKRGAGENAYTENGWNVVEVGMDTDKTTGIERQYVIISNAELGVDGKPLRDENGHIEGVIKNVWVDTFNSWQNSEADNSAEVVEAEKALGHIGAPAVHAEIEVDIVAEAVIKEGAEQAQLDPTKTAEFKQRVNNDLGTLYSELNRFANMPDAAVNNSIGRLVDYTQRQQVDIRRTFEGAAIGALRDPRFANDYYADSVRPALQNLLGSDTSALNRIDSVVSTLIETMSKTSNTDPNYAAYQKNQLVSDMIEQSRAVRELISADNQQAARQTELFLQGLAVGLSDNNSRGNIMRLIQKTLVDAQ